ncbi:MAG: lipoyl(octanoyl) transferase LipB [Pseudomonadota bacterium]|nr:lipoyl(octanoyl) transferase LipB [Pseudomonadota bacterium]
MNVIKCVHIDESDYESIFSFMQQYTKKRTHQDSDYIITTEHKPIYTMGPSSTSNDILIKKDNVKFYKTNRGGKITFHGPGQLIIYTLFDLRRMHIQVHQLLDALETSLLSLLSTKKINGHLDKNNRGVYHNNNKIASLGIRVSKGCTYHGIAINVNTDLSFFNAINPCGLDNIKMQNLSEISDFTLKQVKDLYIAILIDKIRALSPQLIDISSHSDKLLFKDQVTFQT